MKLNLSTDYALRILMFLANQLNTNHSIESLSKACDLPHSSLMKIVSQLVKLEYIKSIRGRYGGVKLGQPANMISIGDVVRKLEKNHTVVDCKNCVFSANCQLQPIFSEAQEAFLSVLDHYTIADLIQQPNALGFSFAPTTE